MVEEEVELTADTPRELKLLPVQIELVPVQHNSLIFFPHVIVEVLSDFTVDAIDNSKCLLKVVDDVEFGAQDVLDLSCGALRESSTLSLVNQSFVLILLLLNDGQVSLGNLCSLLIK